jgi:hypothetical protein
LLLAFQLEQPVPYGSESTGSRADPFQTRIANQRNGTVKASGHVRMKKCYAFLPQHFLYFFPLPQGHWSLRPILGGATTGVSDS